MFQGEEIVSYTAGSLEGIQGSHFFDFHFPRLFPDFREISLTSWYGILVETEIIILNLSNSKTFKFG